MPWDDYRRAIVTVPATSAWVAHELATRPPGTIEGKFAFADTVHFVTAYNPGAPSSAFTNAAADARLLDAVLRLGLVFFRSIGSAADHGGRVEPGFGIVGLDRNDARAIPEEFSQDAIYQWRPDALEIVACSDSDLALGTHHGWSWREVR